MSISEFPEITPEAIALQQLADCEHHLRTWADAPLRLVQAAKEAHLAMYAALTAAVAGSANIGAFKPELRAKWIRHFEDRWQGKVDWPSGDYVMHFEQMLQAARDGSNLGWLTEPIQLSPDDEEMLERLVFLRDCYEHPKTRSHYVEPLWIAQAIPVGVRIAALCLSAVFHHLKAEEIDSAIRAVAQIEELCGQIVLLGDGSTEAPSDVG